MSVLASYNEANRSVQCGASSALARRNAAAFCAARLSTKALNSASHKALAFALQACRLFKIIHRAAHFVNSAFIQSKISKTDANLKTDVVFKKNRKIRRAILRGEDEILSSTRCQNTQQFSCKIVRFQNFLTKIKAIALQIRQIPSR